jgi:hypothetical protein
VLRRPRLLRPGLLQITGVNERAVGHGSTTPLQ